MLRIIFIVVKTGYQNNDPGQYAFLHFGRLKYVSHYIQYRASVLHAKCSP